MRLLTLAAALAVAAAAPAADPKPDAKPAIRVTNKVVAPTPPAPQPVPVPPPAPTPAAFTLAPGKFFVVDSDHEAVTIVTSPPGLLAAQKRSSGVILYGRFADGPDADEERTFAGKSVYTLVPTPAALARAEDGYPEFELFVIPTEVKSAADFLQLPLAVPGKKKPKPDPTPDVKPAPKPTPDPVPDVKPAPKGDREFWAVVLEETGERSVAAAKVLNAADFWRGLAARGHNYRFIDKDNPFAKAGKYLEAAQAKGVALPAVLLFDRNAPAGQPADPVAVFALPATTAEVDTQIKKEGGK